MGAYSSSRIISYQDAQAALGAPTCRRVEEGFARLVAGLGGGGPPPRGASLQVDRKTFQRNVLEAFPYMPAMLSDALFDAFDVSTQGKSLSAQDFACALAILLHGQPEWRIRLLFAILDSAGSGTITLPTVTRLMNAAYGRDNEEVARAFPPAMRGLFGDLARPAELDLAEFAARLPRQRAAMDLLLSWAVHVAKRVIEEPSPKLLALDRKYNPERDLKLIAKQYSVSLAEMETLARTFQYLCRENRGGGMRREVWTHQLLRRYVAPPLARRLFDLLLANPQHGGSESLSLVEVASFVCLASRGPLSQRLHLLFQLFDTDADGFLSRAELRGALTWLIRHRAYREEARRRAVAAVHSRRTRNRASASGSSRQAGHGDEGEDEDDDDALLLSSPSRSSWCSSEGEGEEAVAVEHTRLVLEDQEDPGSSLPSLAMTESVGHAVDALLPPRQPGSSDEPLWSFLEWRTWMTEQRPASQFESYPPRQQLLRDLALMASAELGLRPASALEEREFVYELFKLYTDEVRPPPPPPTTSPSSAAPPDASHGPPPQPAQQQQQAAANAFRRGVPGTVWCLISRSWWDTWRAYVSPKSPVLPDAPTPGPIDNGDLLLRKESRELQPGLHLGDDFQILPPRLWLLLQSWYGGGPTIEREVVGDDLEVYPLCLRWTTCDAHGKPRRFEREVLFSRHGKVEALLVQLCHSIDVEPQNAKLWLVADPADRDVPKERHLMEAQANCTFEQAAAGLLGGTRQHHHQGGGGRGGESAGGGGAPVLVLLELVMENGLWPRTLLMERIREKQEQQHGGRHHQRGGSARGSSGSLASIAGEEGVGEEGGGQLQLMQQGGGLVGLHNLGNTCFINAPLQCLSHTPLLTEYFLSKAYLHDVNMTNQLGTQGRLAQLYYQLLHDLWQQGGGGRSKKVVNPRAIKDLVMTNGIFAGFEQHDAQELLALLLSTLSEDLNRVLEKLYIEQPDSDGRPDHELADIWWRNHFKRELSIIVALFTGQFKVVNTCGECGYASARFETFTVLPLQIPEETHRSVLLLYVPADQEARPPLRVCVRVPKAGVIGDVKAALLALLEAEGVRSTVGPHKGRPLRDEDLVMADVHKSCIFSVVSEERALAGLRDVEAANNAAANGTAALSSSAASSLHCYEVETLNPLPNEAASPPPPPAGLLTTSDLKQQLVGSRRRKVPSSSALSSDGDHAIVLEPSTAGTDLPPPPPPPPSLASGSPSGGPSGKEEAVPASVDHPGEQGLPTREEGEGEGEGVNGGGTLQPPSPGSTQQQRASGGQEAEGQQQLQAGRSGTGEEEEDEQEEACSPSPARPVVSSSSIRDRRGEFFYVAALHRALERAPVYFNNPFELHNFGIPLLFRVRRPPLDGVSSSSSGAKAAEAPPLLTGFRLYNKLYSRLKRLIHTHHKAQQHQPRPPATAPPQSRGTEEKEGGGPPPPPVQQQRMPEVRSMNDMYGTSSTASSTTSGRMNGATTKGGGPSPQHRDDTALRPSEQAASASASGGRPSSSSPPPQLRPSSLVDEDVCGGEVPVPWGFRLRHVTPNGAACSRCHWIQGCCGCLIPASEEYVVDLKEGDAIAVDWHLTVFKELFNFSAAVSVEQHGSLLEHSKRQSEGLSLEQCLDAYTQEERLKDEVYCSKCREHRTNTLRKEEIWRLPPILIVHLKRFHFTTQSRRKLHTLVRFPLDDLDLGPYLASRDQQQQQQQQSADDMEGSGGASSSSSSSAMSEYRLYAVIHHVGAMTVGHYVASIKSQVDGKWYCFNDSRVDEVSEADLVNASAYILFYERKDMANLRFSDLYPTLGLGQPSAHARGASGGAGGAGGMTTEELDRFLRRRDGRGCVVQ